MTYNPASQITSTLRSNDIYIWTGAYNVSRPYTANGLNQYDVAGPAVFGYDPNGNLTATSTPQGSFALTYDVENRRVTATGGLVEGAPGLCRICPCRRDADRAL